MDFMIEEVSNEDAKAVIDLFNHYVMHSFAAYPEEAVPYEFFNLFLNLSKDYPFLVAKDGTGSLLGFALLRPYSPIPVFFKTAELTCFIAPEHTGKGLGRGLLSRLLDAASKKGIKNILAGISSLNLTSLAFHSKCGFVECGRFPAAGRKWGRDFDVVWMHKVI